MRVKSPHVKGRFARDGYEAVSLMHFVCGFAAGAFFWRILRYIGGR